MVFENFPGSLPKKNSIEALSPCTGVIVIPAVMTNEKMCGDPQWAELVVQFTISRYQSNIRLLKPLPL